MSKRVAVIASLLGSFVVACGGGSTGSVDDGAHEHEGRVPAGPTAAATTTAPPAETSPPPATTTAPPVSTAPSKPSGSSSSSSGGPGICEPNAECGGLSQCVDSCYTDRCCYLGCACNTSTGRLECALRCGD